MTKLSIRSSDGEMVKGDLIYHGHELLRVTGVGRWRKDHTRSSKFRVIGKVNLDRMLKPVATQSARREYIESLHKLSGHLKPHQHVSIEAGPLFALITYYLADQDIRKLRAESPAPLKGEQ